MYSQRPNSSLNLLRRFLVVLALVTLAAGNLSSLQVGGQTQPGRPRRATAESPGKPSEPQSSRDQQSPEMLDEEYGNIVRKENATVLTAFIVIKRFLPPPTRVASGYRDAEDQLALIGRMARRNNIDVPPNMRVDDPSTWGGPLRGLHNKGFIIMAPERTPHSSNDFIVFDLAGADLDQIAAGCRRAAENGLIVLRKALIERVNNGVHVELNLKPKAFMELGLEQPIAGTLTKDSNASEETLSTLPQDNRRALFDKLQRDHDSKRDPLKQIDDDRQKIALYDPITEYAAIKELNDEIERHKGEVAKLAQDGAKTEATNKYDAAFQDGRLEDAEQAAKKFMDAFPDDPKAKLAWSQVRTLRLVNEAIDTLIRGGCGECEKSGQLIDEALVVSSDDPVAKRIKGEVSACLAGCRTKRTAIIIIVVLFAAGTIVGLYFVLGPKKWVLEGVYGPCKGKVFPLNKQKMKIGAADSPEDEIDVVISDTNHKISRLHCSLRQDGRRWYLKDKSSNGTKINDVKMGKDRYVKLRNGDEISLADEALLRFRPR